MGIRVAINGFGRIGRLTFRNLMQRSDEFDVVAVNDLTDNRTLATLLKYDSIHGRYAGQVDYDEENLIVDGHPLRALAERNPADLPWGDLGVDVVIESTGIFTARAADGKAGYDSHLADRTGIGRALGLNHGHRLDQRRRSRAVANSPTGHGVGLGNAVHGQGPFGEVRLNRKRGVKLEPVIY